MPRTELSLLDVDAWLPPDVRAAFLPPLLALLVNFFLPLPAIASDGNAGNDLELTSCQLPLFGFRFQVRGK